MTDFDPRTPSQRNTQIPGSHTSGLGASNATGSRTPETSNHSSSHDQPTRRNPIYRAAYRYFFENYGSSRFGTAGKYRSNTLIGAIAAVAGAIYIAPSWRQGNIPELAICLLVAIGGLLAVIHNGPEWGKYARLARNFAVGAVQGGLKTQTGAELAACKSVADIPDLFSAAYPWC